MLKLLSVDISMKCTNIDRRDAHTRTDMCLHKAWLFALHSRVASADLLFFTAAAVAAARCISPPLATATAAAAAAVMLLLLLA